MQALSILYYGAPRACPDIFHATGFSASDPVTLLVHPDGTLDLVVSELELGRASRQVPHATVWSAGKLGFQGRSSLADQIVALCRRRGLRRLAVGSEFPFGLAKSLEKEGLDLTSFPSRGLRPQRVVKTADELKKLRATQRAAVAGMLRAKEMIDRSEIGPRNTLLLDGKPLTAERVRAAMRAEILPLDCIDEDTIVACGDQAVDPHEMGHGPLKAGKFIVIDFFPRSLTTGYWGDLTRTYWRGDLSDEQRKMYETVRKVQTAVKRLVVPGADGARIHAFVEETFAKAGYKTYMEDGRMVGYFHGTGHGVGLEIHENPVLGRVKNELAENMVVTDEPGLYYPGLGGVRIEDTVVVTPSGGKPLATCPIPSAK